MVTNPCARPGLPGAWSCPLRIWRGSLAPARCRDRPGAGAPGPPAPCGRGPDDAL